MQETKIGFETLSDNEIQKVETRISNQLENGVTVVDVKVDLSNFLRQQNIANENDRRSIVGVLVRLVRLV